MEKKTWDTCGKIVSETYSRLSITYLSRLVGTIERVDTDIAQEQVASMQFTVRRSSRARRIRATVFPGGDLCVVAPVWISSKTIRDFVQINLSWLELAVARQKRAPRVIPLKHGTREYQKTKSSARALVIDRLRFFNAHYGFQIGQISIRNQKSRWGSCSHRGNLSFNFKIAQLPQELADYIVVHELCHVGELNHSKHFWSLVARTIPDYAARRAALRQYSLR